MDRSNLNAHQLADNATDRAEDSVPPAKKASPASLLDQAAALLTRLSGGSAQTAPPSASSSLTATLAAMSEDMRRLPDPTDHTIDWGKDPIAADLSRARELYLQAFALRDTQDRARLAPIVTNMLRALTRVHAEGTRWEGDVNRLRPLAEQAYRALASGT